MEELKDKDYFVNFEESKDKIIVYVKYMNSKVLSEIPIKFNNKNVFVHYSDFKEAKKVNFQEFDLKNISARAREIDPELLKTIFYEINDGDDAITNVKDEYIEIYNLIKPVYDKYGFDVTHDALFN
jgi:hypothetical protein